MKRTQMASVFLLSGPYLMLSVLFFTTGSFVLAEANAASAEKFHEKRKIKYEKLLENFDGSISIVQPRLLYEGVYLRVAVGLDSYRLNCSEGDYFIFDSELDFPSSPEGLCKLFERNGKWSLTYDQFERGADAGIEKVTAIELNSEGGVEQLQTPLWTNCLGAGAGKYAVLKTVNTITCR